MFQTLGEILHVHPLIFAKILRRLREVNYLLKATQLASSRARIRLRQSLTPDLHARVPAQMLSGRRKDARQAQGPG